MCDIPLLDIPKLILEKYKSNPICTERGVLLPVPSNQRMNGYLKEIADICNIKKNLSTHVVRHSFATLSISYGVPIESVSKMLGHTNIRTTQIYAKIIDTKLSANMDIFAKKLNERKIIIYSGNIVYRGGRYRILRKAK